MRQFVRIGSVLVLALALGSASLAGTPEDEARAQLKQATELFAQQEYSAAQEALKKADRAKLNEEDQAGFDLLEQVLPRAIAGSKAAEETLGRADQAFADGHWDDADKLYQQVLENEFAKSDWKSKATAQREAVAEKKRLAQAAEPSGVVRPEPAPEQPAAPGEQPSELRRLTPVEESKLTDQLFWQRAEQQSRDLALKARDAIAAKRFTEARQLAEDALQKIEAARRYAEPVSKYLTAKEAAERLKQEVADAEKAQAELDADQNRVEITRRITERKLLQEEQRRTKIEQLFNTASQLRKQQKFDEAAEVLRQILSIDPANARAQDQLEVVEDYASLSRQHDWEGDLRTQTRSALVSAEEALIPWDVEVLYPKNWLELTARRSAAGAGAGGQLEEGELNRKLDEILPDFEFQEAPLEAVVEHLQDITKVNIAMDWQDLEGAGIERDRPVTVNLKELPLRVVLQQLLSQAGGDVKLSFSSTDGLLRIATKDKLSKNKLALVYDIRDLLVNIPRFSTASLMDPGQTLADAGRSGQGGNGQLFQSQQSDEQQSSQDDTSGTVAKIMEIIRQQVEPDSWVDSGGGDGSIRELNGQLIIYNTSEAHGQIRGLLDQLRATRALQIALEARFLNVTSNFLEEFGVDLDFVFNSGSAGFDRALTPAGAGVVDPFTGANVLIPRDYSRIGSTASPPGFGTPLTPAAGIAQPYQQAALVPSGTGVSPHFSDMTPITAQQNSMDLASPSQINTGVPGSFAQRVTQPAMNIAGTFLDNLQVDFLIRATQANGRSSIVQAPRLVLFNGQSSKILVGRTRQYVSSVEPQIAEGAVGVRPITNAAFSGTELGVDATISADRRYVTVTVITSQTDEPTFERFEVQRSSGNSPGIFILLPDQSFARINTTVSIPDGGTVLLGGMKQVGEVEVEAGVPILSKIPVLKRAFSNKSMVKDTRTLLILMKAKIIIQKEAEEEAFPTFGTASGA